LANLRDENFDHELFWRRSVTTAVSSSLLAERCDPRVQDEAFAAGLLADLGILAANQCARSDYQPVLKRYQEGSRPLQEVEGRQLGVTHAEMSAGLLGSWKLPDRLVLAARHHHDDGIPPIDEDGHYLTRLVWTAALISDLFCQDAPSTDLDPLKETIVQALGGTVPEGGVAISPDDIDTILEGVDQYVCQMAQDISLQIGETKSYEELRVMAMAQLAQLSVSAELDLAAASQKAAEAQQQIEALSTEKRALTRTANTDDLTQIANRKAFNDEIERAVKYARDTGHSIGLLMCDLDHFKRINDAYGHTFGDEALKALGEVLGGLEDRAHFVARYGGEEFAVICFRSTLDDLADIAETVRREIEKIELKYGTQIVRITTSVGAAQADAAMGELTVEGLIKRADKCLFEAKREGRNRIMIAR
jgi:diguanylate cyclase (GGDEF)-like protein